MGQRCVPAACAHTPPPTLLLCVCALCVPLLQDELYFSQTFDPHIVIKALPNGTCVKVGGAQHPNGCRRWSLAHSLQAVGAHLAALASDPTACDPRLLPAFPTGCWDI